MAVTFISKSAAHADSTSLTVTAPSDIQDGDILLCFMYGESEPTSDPDGWAQIGSWYNESGAWWKRASSESGDYTWGFSGTSSNGAVIMVYRGCIASGSPIDDYSGDQAGDLYTTSDTTVRAFSVTTSNDGAMLVAVGRKGYGSDDTVAPPTGMTEVHEDWSSVYNQNLFAAYVEQTSAGSSGNKDFTVGAAGTDKHGWLLALLPAFSVVGQASNSGTGTSLTVTHGLSIAEGDLVLIIANQNGGNTLDDDPSYPFTAGLYAENPNTKSISIGIYYRVAGASEPATYTFSSSYSDSWTMFCVVLRGANNTTIWDVQPSMSNVNYEESQTTLDAPSIDTNYDNSMVFYTVFTDGWGTGYTHSSPTNGFGNLLEASGQPGATCLTRKVQSTAGTVGATQTTLSGADDFQALLWAVREYVEATGYTLVATQDGTHIDLTWS